MSKAHRFRIEYWWLHWHLCTNKPQRKYKIFSKQQLSLIQYVQLTFLKDFCISKIANLYTMQIMQLQFLIQRSGRQVYKHKTKERYIRKGPGATRGWTVGSNIMGGDSFCKTLKIMRFLGFPFYHIILFLQGMKNQTMTNHGLLENSNIGKERMSLTLIVHKEFLAGKQETKIQIKNISIL